MGVTALQAYRSKASSSSAVSMYRGPSGPRRTSRIRCLSSMSSEARRNLAPEMGRNFKLLYSVKF